MPTDFLKTLSALIICLLRIKSAPYERTKNGFSAKDIAPLDCPLLWRRERDSEPMFAPIVGVTFWVSCANVTDRHRWCRSVGFIIVQLLHQTKRALRLQCPLLWRRERDSNPRWGISPNTISSRAP